MNWPITIGLGIKILSETEDSSIALPTITQGLSPENYSVSVTGISIPCRRSFDGVYRHSAFRDHSAVFIRLSSFPGCLGISKFGRISGLISLPAERSFSARYLNPAGRPCCKSRPFCRSAFRSSRPLFRPLFWRRRSRDAGRSRRCIEAALFDLWLAYPHILIEGHH